jgi:hypothetical protein
MHGSRRALANLGRLKKFLDVRRRGSTLRVPSSFSDRCGFGASDFQNSKESGNVI